MAEMTVAIESINEGTRFIRSDDKEFILVKSEDGNAQLYPGGDPNDLPLAPMLDLDVDIADKVGAALPYVLAYPEEPANL